MATDVQTVVIGAGVVGLAVAQALIRRGHDVLVLERHDRIGAETSSRNSEVIHAGLYYPPGSLKARLCVEGKERLYAFARDNGIAVKRTGKLLVATSVEEIGKLESIARNAAANGVSDLVPLSGEEARRLEPELSCIKAVLSPSTGVVDSHALMLALEGHIGAGRVVLNTTVTGLSQDPSGDFEIASSSLGADARLTAGNLVIAAGLGASRLGRMIGATAGYRVPETHTAKGHYFTLAGKAPFRHLVYPMPQAGSLGIHLTLDVAGQAKFGPDIEWVETADYAFEDPDGERRRNFERQVRRYWPGLPDAALVPAYTGLRPKIHAAGEPAADFAIHGQEAHGIPRLVALYGIESPGLTSSLAIGSTVAARLG